MRHLLLASALAVGTMAQTTSVIDLFLDDVQGENIQGSVISAAPSATTYFVNCAPGTDSSDCGLRSGITFVNGPSTFGLHVTEADAFTEDVDCQVTAERADCIFTVAGPEADNPGQGMAFFVGLTDSLTPVTITAGLEKILAAGTATSIASTATSGTAQTAASASSGPSETSASVSQTSASGSASSPSTTASSGAAGMGWNAILAGICGVVALFLGL